MDRRLVAELFIEQQCRKEKRVVTGLIRGTSMGDTLLNGSRVSVQLDEHPKLRSGQIVCIRRNAKLVVHRLIFYLGPWCLEKGDANPFPRFCRRSDIIGVLVMDDI